MVMTAVIVLIALAVSLCNSLKKRVGVVKLVSGLFIAVIFGTFFGGVASLLIGNFFVPKTSVVTNTEVLEPVVAGGKEKFLIDKVSINPFGGTCNYVYFTKNQQGNIEEHSIALKNESIVFKKGVRSKQDFFESITNKKLDWFFFSGVKKVKIILSSEEDIF